jgi:hypothetical protein
LDDASNQQTQQLAKRFSLRQLRIDQGTKTPASFARDPAHVFRSRRAYINPRATAP